MGEGVVTFQVVLTTSLARSGSDTYGGALAVTR